MKKLISKIAFILILQSFANNIFAHVELDYPVGGETFTTGQTITIQWHIAIAHNTLNWDVFYSPDGGDSWEPIQMNLPASSLSYTWTVPSNATAQARVSVIQDNSGQDYQDESTNFHIVLPVMPPEIITEAHDFNFTSIYNQSILISSWLDDHGGATANSFCGGLFWTNNFTDLSNECGLTGSAIVTFTATDACGSTETVATCTITDPYPPSFNSLASPLVVECDGNGNISQFNSWLGINGGATATDNGGHVNWSASYTNQELDCGLTTSVSILFSATDDCDNSVSTPANFIIEDHTAPDIQAPAQGIVIDCGQPNTQALLQNWLQNSGGAMATDVCGNVAWTNNFPLLPDTCNGSITEWTVLFTAMDDCGNLDTTSAVVTFIDVLSGASDILLSGPGFTISPNPVGDILKVEFADDANSFERITLFDGLGHPVKVFQPLTKEMYIDVDGFAPGLYYLHTQTAHGVGARKVVIE